MRRELGLEQLSILKKIIFFAEKKRNIRLEVLFFQSYFCFILNIRGVYESQIFHTKHLNILFTPPAIILLVVEQYSNIYKDKETINKVHFILKFSTFF